MKKNEGNNISTFSNANYKFAFLKFTEAAVAENKAQYFFLLGKTWSVTQPVNEECVNILSKAVKLNPTHLDAWNALGECLVHLKRFSEAKYCFLASLKHVINILLVDQRFKYA